VGTTVLLSEDQEEIRSVSRAFLEARFPSTRVRELMASDTGFATSDWREIADLGWPGIAVSEDRGGAGYGTVELCILLEEMGRVLLGDPFFGSAVLAANAIAIAGNGPSADALLTAIAEGSTLATLVARGDLHCARAAHGTVGATPVDDGYALSGDGGTAIGAPTADLLVVAARLTDGSTGLFQVDPDALGVRRSRGRTIDETRKSARVEFEAASATRLDGGADVTGALDHALAVATIGLAAEMVGGAQRCLEMTLGYLNEREQFGVLIGSFQALKHRVADASLLIDGARELVRMGADAVDSGDVASIPMLASAAKAAASDAYVHTAQETIQLHGGIGFTWEHDAHLYYRRAVVSAATLGTATDQREHVAEALLG
jgi:alkylation response protein AidB-like acyl-CoA dehydrogenase